MQQNSAKSQPFSLETRKMHQVGQIKYYKEIRPVETICKIDR